MEVLNNIRNAYLRSNIALFCLMSFFLEDFNCFSWGGPANLRYRDLDLSATPCWSRQFHNLIKLKKKNVNLKQILKCINVTTAYNQHFVPSVHHEEAKLQEKKHNITYLRKTNSNSSNRQDRSRNDNVMDTT